jgi:hypothetical protein
MPTLLKDGIDITDLEELALKDSLLDSEQWLREALRGKIANCKKRMRRQWFQILLDDPTVTSIPALEDALIALIVARPDYKNRAERDAEEASLDSNPF